MSTHGECAGVRDEFESESEQHDERAIRENRENATKWCFLATRKEEEFEMIKSIKTNRRADDAVTADAVNKCAFY